MDIGLDNEAIFRNQTVNMHKAEGVEGVLTCLIEMLEYAYVISDKLKEITEKEGKTDISHGLEHLKSNIPTSVDIVKILRTREQRRQG